MWCTGVQTLQKIRPNQQWPTIHGESPQHENHCNTQGQNIQEEFSDRSSSRQLQPSSRQLQPSSKNMQQTNMLWSSAARVSHMALPSVRPFYSYIMGSSSYLSSTKVTTTFKKYNTLQNHLKTEQWKLSTSWTAKPWQLWKRCIHRLMSPHVSNCM